MINFEREKQEIIKALLPLEPAKIILFGSFAYGKPTEESDIDLLIVKETPKEEVKELRLKARRNLRNFIFKNHIGIDIVVDSQERINHRIQTVKDQFYGEIMEKGKLLYAK
jgi:predicted nucleotidyltransferase